MKRSPASPGYRPARRWMNNLDAALAGRQDPPLPELCLMSPDRVPSGLGLDATAWTLTIRKYGDMVGHRLLKAVIAGKTQVSAPAWS